MNRAFVTRVLDRRAVTALRRSIVGMTAEVVFVAALAAMGLIIAVTVGQLVP